MQLQHWIPGAFHHPLAHSCTCTIHSKETRHWLISDQLLHSGFAFGRWALCLYRHVLTFLFSRFQPSNNVEPELLHLVISVLRTSERGGPGFAVSSDDRLYCWTLNIVPQIFQGGQRCPNAFVLSTACESALSFDRSLLQYIDDELQTRCVFVTAYLHYCLANSTLLLWAFLWFVVSLVSSGVSLWCIALHLWLSIYSVWFLCERHTSKGTCLHFTKFLIVVWHGL